MIVVSGASGFVGRAVCKVIAAAGRSYRGISRAATDGLINVGPIDGTTNWSSVLAGADAVIHLAARVHILRDKAIDPLALFRAVNVDGTLNLARQAVCAGVRRFVFVSSIKVNGEETAIGEKFTADDVPNPSDFYAISKNEAEKGLWQISLETGLEVVIVRPPLIYGPGVGANFATMMQLIARGVPLPFGAVYDNRRSLLGVDNMAHFLLYCTDHDEAPGETFLVSDGEDVSTAELLRTLGVALGRPARLIPVPKPVLVHAARFTGQQRLARRLLGSLQIDANKTKRLLNWNPPVDLASGIAKTAADFKRRS